MALQVGDKGAAVGGALFFVAQIVDFQGQVLGNAQLTPQVGAHGDHFGVDVWAVVAECFDADLVELAVAAFLRPFAAEHRPHVPEFLRAVVQKVVFDDGAQAGGRSLGAQAEADGVVGIGEGVHFFADDVGFFADGADKQAGLLDDGRADLAVTEAPRPTGNGIFKCLPEGRGKPEVFLFDRQQIVHAFYGLDFLSHAFTFCRMFLCPAQRAERVARTATGGGVDAVSMFSDGLPIGEAV